MGINYHFLLALAYSSSAINKASKRNLQGAVNDGFVAVIYFVVGVAETPFAPW